MTETKPTVYLSPASVSLLSSLRGSTGPRSLDSLRRSHLTLSGDRIMRGLEELCDAGLAVPATLDGDGVARVWEVTDRGRERR